MSSLYAGFNHVNPLARRGAIVEQEQTSISAGVSPHKHLRAPKRGMMANPQPPALHGRPRATPYRCFVRLRDRLELVLERLVDGDPTAQAEFERYKADRDRWWAERDRRKKRRKEEKKDPAAAIAISIINGPSDETPVRDAASPGTDYLFPQNHVDEETGPDLPETRDMDKGKGKENAPCPGDHDGDGDDVERPPGAAGGSTARRRTDALPRGTQRSATFPSLVGSTLGEKRRRKMKRSDARPGYFDPDPCPQGPSCGINATVTEVGVGDEDRLEMNIPVEFSGFAPYRVLVNCTMESRVG